MTDPLTVALLTVGGCALVYFLVKAAAAGGDFKRVGLSCKASWRVLRDPDAAAKVEALLGPPKPTTPPKPSGAPLRLLTLMQREGRLLDFLLEDIGAYPNEQIGAAVRDIHKSCQHALKEHLVLEPVLSQPEDADVDVPAGFDPSAIRLTGNVTGQPPFRGKLLHHGWRVKEIKIAAPPEGQDEFVVQPAEVELP
jgi:hypothetical protein